MNEESVTNSTALKLIDAAAHLFMQRGYRAVSISDILRAAKVTKPTLYYYFPDKEELYVQMCLRVTERMGAELRAAREQPLPIEERLSQLAAVLLRTPDMDMGLMFHEMEEHLNPTNQRRLGQAFHNHVFAQIEQVMREEHSTGALGSQSPAALTWIFLRLALAFHHEPQRQNEQAGFDLSEMNMPPAQFVALLLRGVTGLQEHLPESIGKLSQHRDQRPTANDES